MNKIDYLIAEKVFGYKWWTPQELKPFNMYSSEEGNILLIPNFKPKESEYPLFLKSHIPIFSEQIDAAWKVIEEMSKKGWDVEINSYMRNDVYTGIAYRVSFTNLLSESTAYSPMSPARAICEAALKALGVNNV